MNSDEPRSLTKEEIEYLTSNIPQDDMRSKAILNIIHQTLSSIIICPSAIDNGESRDEIDTMYKQYIQSL